MDLYHHHPPSVVTMNDSSRGGVDTSDEAASPLSSAPSSPRSSSRSPTMRNSDGNSNHYHQHQHHHSRRVRTNINLTSTTTTSRGITTQLQLHDTERTAMQVNWKTVPPAATKVGTPEPTATRGMAHAMPYGTGPSPSDDLPFDESDEKKMDLGDELMGTQPELRRRRNSWTMSYDDEDIYLNDEGQEDEPPSLAIQRPGLLTLSQRAKTTGRDVPSSAAVVSFAKTRHEFGTTVVMTTTTVSRGTATSASTSITRQPRHEPLGVGPDKRQGEAQAQEADADDKVPTTMATHHESDYNVYDNLNNVNHERSAAILTPESAVISPPQVVKQALWETKTSRFDKERRVYYDNNKNDKDGNDLDAVVQKNKIATTSTMATAVKFVSPDKTNSTEFYPSFYHEEGVNGRMVAETSMISSSLSSSPEKKLDPEQLDHSDRDDEEHELEIQEVDYRRRQRPRSARDGLHNRVMDEFDQLIAAHDEEGFSIYENDIYDDHNHNHDTQETHEIEYEIDAPSEEDSPVPSKQFVSFQQNHPQRPQQHHRTQELYHHSGGVVTESTSLVPEKPKVMVFRSRSEDHTKTLGGSSMEWELDNKNPRAVEPNLAARPRPYGSKPAGYPIMQRSASESLRPSHIDIAPSGASSHTSDWNKYLETRGDSTTKKGTNSTVNDFHHAWLNVNDTEPYGKPHPEYREMTPKKDFQSSDKSAGWLQEELKRRTIIKMEINDAILARHEHCDADDEGDEVSDDDQKLQCQQQDAFADALTKALQSLPSQIDPSVTDYVVNGEASQSLEDEEVAAITNPRPHHQHLAIMESSSSSVYKSEDDDEFEKPKPRRLEYGGAKEDMFVRPTTTKSCEEYSGDSMLSSNSWHATSSVGRQVQVPRVTAEVLASPEVLAAAKSRAHHNESSRSELDGELQEKMLRFASDTRAALRGKSSPVPITVVGNIGSHAAAVETAPLTSSPFRSLAEGRLDDPKLTIKAARGIARVTSGGSGSVHSISDADLAELQNLTPVLVQSMDSVYGIAKGDIMLSLLNENTGRIETSRRATWANRVHGAIWRCRRMRRTMAGFPPISIEVPAANAPRGRSSRPSDSDKAHLAGGVQSVQATQEAALNHLKQDEIDEALELFEGIIFTYYSFFEKCLKAREENPGQQRGITTDFKPYIGVALHNLGILNLLNGEYQDALSYFGRALENRKSCLGEGHPDHVASLVKLATCHYALNEFADAHRRLEQALVYSRKNCPTLGDCMLKAEILNNLGCLAYMCGQPVAANSFFRESLDVQFEALSQSLYEGTAFLGQSISLNISITRANIGFVKLVTKDFAVAITALENALMEQQMLLKGANDTVVATMDHLAVANLLNGDQKKAASMFGRILDLQQSEYGPHDRRCFVTIDKINMVQSRGTNFEQAIEELRKTFSVPEVAKPSKHSPSQISKKKENKTPQTVAKSHTPSWPKSKGQKNKVLQVLSSMRKKATAPR